MRISYSQLKKCQVETQSGVGLGHVCDMVLDVDGQHIVQYEVKQSMLSTKKYLVNREQVVSITAEKIIVEDSVVGEKKKQVASTKSTIGQEAVAMREEG